jgi:uncharacterized protein with NRDE domain
MCLLTLAIDQSRRFPLVLAANRDEFFARPAARMAWWSPGAGLPDVLGGRDLEAGGTWLGLTAQGRFAAVTNVRSPLSPRDPGAPSRGAIVPAWLSGDASPDRFWMRTSLSGYNGFNLIAADFQNGECFYGTHQSPHPVRLERGLYGLSNAGLDTPWPKVLALKEATREALEASDTADTLAGRLFDALADRTQADDDELPSTGVSPEWEKVLSSAFIRSADGLYGTRCATLVITERVNKRLVTHVFERTFGAAGGLALLRRVTLKDWPPRYTEAPPATAAVQEAVLESTEAQEPHHPLRRTRVRTLLKPDPARRRRAA